MSAEILVALIAMVGTVLGSAGGILTSSRLTNYRLKELEKRVDEHNRVVVRTDIIEEQMKGITRRVEDLEKHEEYYHIQGGKS